jgi:L-ascorbate metabolism protein UlaG (beta-lactamase superfamily)
MKGVDPGDLLPSFPLPYLEGGLLPPPFFPGGAMTDFLDGVTWFRHSSLRIRRRGIEIHVDPWGVTEKGEADYILLTHPHYDNFSEEDIAKVRGPETVLVAPTSMRKQLSDVDHLLRPGDLIQLDRIDILAVPAHNRGGSFTSPTRDGWDTYSPSTTSPTSTPATPIS